MVRGDVGLNTRGLRDDGFVFQGGAENRKQSDFVIKKTGFRV